MTPEAGRSVVTLRWALAAPGSVEAVRAVLAALAPLGCAVDVSATAT